MSQSPFARSLFISACVSGVVFSIAAAPFAMFKSNTVGVKLQNQDVYSAELKYLAGPYLALAGGISAAVGLGAFGLVGWRQSARKVAGAESKRQEMERSLAVHQAELERIKFSEARLRSQNLTAFLQPEMDSTPVTQTSSFSEPMVLEAAPKAIAEVRRTRPQAGAVQPVVLESPRSSYEANPESGHEPLESLLLQLHQIAQQVEELRGQGDNQLAA